MGVIPYQDGWSKEDTRVSCLVSKGAYVVEKSKKSTKNRVSWIPVGRNAWPPILESKPHSCVFFDNIYKWWKEGVRNGRRNYHKTGRYKEAWTNLFPRRISKAKGAEKRAFPTFPVLPYHPIIPHNVNSSPNYRPWGGSLVMWPFDSHNGGDLNSVMKIARQ